MNNEDFHVREFFLYKKRIEKLFDHKLQTLIIYDLHLQNLEKGEKFFEVDD